MIITAIKLNVLTPPQDDLFSNIRASKLKLKEGDVVAVSSKVVSIHEERCVPVGSIDKDSLAKREASLYLERNHVPGRHALHTITNGVLIRSAGIDESNANGYYVLWPQDPMRSAAKIRKFLQQMYKVKKLGVIITDSISTPLRRGATGFALGWAGFDPVYDYRGTKDIFGRVFKAEQANLGDALAVAAVLAMGEGSEQTPLALLRDVSGLVWKRRHTTPEYRSLAVPLKEDIFAPFLTKVKWKKGHARSKSSHV